MKYVLILLGVLLMAEVVQMGGSVSVSVSWGKKRALPDIDDEALLDERDVNLTPEEEQVLTKDLTSKIKDVVKKERQKFGKKRYAEMTGEAMNEEAMRDVDLTPEQKEEVKHDLEKKIKEDVEEERLKLGV